MKKIIALYVFFTIFIYLCFAFVNWEFNPYVWGAEKRGGLVFFMGLNLVIAPLGVNLSGINK
jgi:hypothetical protein